MQKPYTFIMLKPDTVHRNLVSDVIKMLTQKGVIILEQKQVTVDEKTILAHYQEVIDKLNLPHFKPAVLDTFVGKQVVILRATVKEGDPVSLVRQYIGPTDPAKADKDTIRGFFGNDTLDASKQEKRMLRNLVHASDSAEAAEKEANLWFR